MTTLLICWKGMMSLSLQKMRLARSNAELKEHQKPSGTNRKHISFTLSSYMGINISWLMCM